MSRLKEPAAAAAVALLAVAGCGSPAKEAPPQPAAASPQEPDRRVLERRAIEAVIWGMPAVNYDLMRQAMLTATSAKENDIVYWSRPADSKNQTLTPNPDSIYFMSFWNTK